MARPQNAICSLSASEMVSLYAAKELSPVDVLNDALRRIEQFNPATNAFCHVDHEGALLEAKASEHRWMRGEPLGIIDGVPCTVKDLLLTRGMPTRKGSRTTSIDAPHDVDAPVVAAMRRSGGVILGKTTTSEFGWKGVCDSPLTGITRNPWNTLMTPGGSSGGAAVAAALNLGALHLGTDAGGSVRIPAAFTGVVGMKPTFGFVPQWPTSAMGTLSHIGPITRTVQDAAIMQTVITHTDQRDTLSGENQPRDWVASLGGGVKGLRIACSPTFGYAFPDPCVLATTNECASLLEAMGAIVDFVDPGFEDVTEVVEVLWYGGAANILSKIEFPLRSELDLGFLRVAEAGQRIGVVEYLHAVDRRNELSQRMAAFFRKWDLLLSPTVAITAFEAGRDVPDGSDSDSWFSWSPYCHPFNLTQQPAISIPFGKSHDGMPIGIQLAGPRFRDDLVLSVADAILRNRPPRVLAEPVELVPK